MGFTVTCAELPGLMRDLRAVDRTLASEAKRNIRKAEKSGIQAVQAAALNAGGVVGKGGHPGMTKAARAVKPNNRYSGKSASLGLKVDARIAPNARPLDHPNEGGFNRHPVFGRRHFGPSLPGSRTAFIGHVSQHGSTVWVNQPSRPFFLRGSLAAFDACENEMEAALSAVVRILGRG